MRSSSTDRIGVLETAMIVTKKLGWIFREQPLVDVGVDAIIEQTVDGEPLGKFMAVQIKSGKGNFNSNEKYLTLYVSNIHYNYWLNLNIPIILVAHLPEVDKTYWEHICKSNFQKTSVRWKLDIPKRQEFNEKSKSKLTEILSGVTERSFELELYKGKVEPDTIFDIVENIVRISNANDCIVNLTGLLECLKVESDIFNNKLESFIRDELTDKSSIVKACFDSFGFNLNLISHRMEVEIGLFSELFSKGLYAFEKVVLLDYCISCDYERIQSAQYSIEKLPKAIEGAINGINYLKSAISKISNKYSVLKESKSRIINIFDIVIIEFTDAKNMTEIILSNVECKKNK